VAGGVKGAFDIERNKSTMALMNGNTLKILSNLCFGLGFASILGSIAIWYLSGGQGSTEAAVAHGERFGIFVGLWAPTFFILSNRFDRYRGNQSTHI